MSENPDTIRARLRRYLQLRALVLDVDAEAVQALDQMIAAAERQLSDQISGTTPATPAERARQPV